MSGAIRPKLPPWIRVKIESGDSRREVGEILDRHGLNTVCRGARCPNLGECWHRRTATFMIMGGICTRDCRFCAVPHGRPEVVEPAEPAELAAAAKEMGLKYVVVTSVTRDDLEDGGASVFVEVINELRRTLPPAGIEVLTPDFNGDEEAVTAVIDAGPTVFNHNVETVERLAGVIRDGATYRRSLKVLTTAFNSGGGKIPVKSGMMVGLGETDAEVEDTIRDIRGTGASILTIGQYLPPDGGRHPLDRYVEPAKFAEWKQSALNLGFDSVASGPLVRSSYRAGELAEGGT